MTAAPAEVTTPFERVGGEPGVRQLVDRFYDLMDLEPAFAGIRALHPQTLDGSRDKLFWFLCGWLGGPNTTPTASAIRCCAHGICPTPSASASATSGWRAWCRP